jgi:hypothetical protein
MHRRSRCVGACTPVIVPLIRIEHDLAVRESGLPIDPWPAARAGAHDHHSAGAHRTTARAEVRTACAGVVPWQLVRHRCAHGGTHRGRPVSASGCAATATTSAAADAGIREPGRRRPGDKVGGWVSP